MRGARECPLLCPRPVLSATLLLMPNRSHGGSGRSSHVLVCASASTLRQHSIRNLPPHNPHAIRPKRRTASHPHVLNIDTIVSLGSLFLFPPPCPLRPLLSPCLPCALPAMIGSPDTQFCGYTIPHPSEPKMNMRLQTGADATSHEVLRDSLETLRSICDHVQDSFQIAKAKGAP